ncbi:MAG TPA: tetratricopeptide repeat protein [Blastocatellia bacterium]|nr:tetratricopeptide repeat protein [Blastocatellia bacterium]
MSRLKINLAGFVVLFVVAAASVTGIAAQGPARGPVDSNRDPILEISAKHNLETARWYITKRKALKGALDRLQEIIDTYPEFSRMDEVLYWMGECNLKLDNVDAAGDFFSKMLKAYPSSEFAKKARIRLDELKAEKKS